MFDSMYVVSEYILSSGRAVLGASSRKSLHDGMAIAAKATMPIAMMFFFIATLKFVVLKSETYV